MKQIVTIFRAEGPQARRLIRLCRAARKAELFRLRDTWRNVVRSSARLSGYFEYVDGWSMGNDFSRIMGPGTTRREAISGEVYFCIVTARMLTEFRRQARRKQQFHEQRVLARVVADLANGFGVCDPPVALALFREVVGGSITDQEMKDGSNLRLNGTVRKLAGR